MTREATRTGSAAMSARLNASTFPAAARSLGRRPVPRPGDNGRRRRSSAGTIRRSWRVHARPNCLLPGGRVQHGWATSPPQAVRVQWGGANDTSAVGRRHRRSSRAAVRHERLGYGLRRRRGPTAPPRRRRAPCEVSSGGAGLVNGRRSVDCGRTRPGHLRAGKTCAKFEAGSALSNLGASASHASPISAKDTERRAQA